MRIVDALQQLNLPNIQKDIGSPTESQKIILTEGKRTLPLMEEYAQGSWNNS